MAPARDEWAKQRAFLINEHMKHIDTIQEEAQVRVHEDKHKMDWSLKEERLEMQAQVSHGKMAKYEKSSPTALHAQTSYLHGVNC